MVSISGKEDASVKVITNSDIIQIQLPSGNLILSVADVLQRLYASMEKGSHNATLYVTQHISLQLLTIDKH